MLLKIKITGDFNLVVTRKEFHFLHRRLDADSFWRHVHRIDVVVELDPNRRLLERVIERAKPLHVERFGFADRHYLQVRKRAAAFRVE